MLPSFDGHAPLVIVGAGAAGLAAALAAIELGVEPLVIERDPVPQGSTALSAGLIPAAGTRAQAIAGVTDTPKAFAADIQMKAKGRADPTVLALVAEGAGPAIDWLAERHGLPFTVITDFLYPGHSASRMHGLPSRSGAELIDRLRAAVEAAGVTVLGQARVTELVADGSGRVLGATIERPDGASERIGCDALVLACNGYGGNKAMVARHIPSLANALYFGHPGNQGDAARWGEALGAELRGMSGHQGHGSVAHPHGILITWATIMEGGVQVNLAGQRFWDESQGYSEAAEAVLAQSEGMAWTIFDERIAAICRQFEDFRRAEAAGAIVSAGTAEELADRMKISAQAIRETLESVDRWKTAEPVNRNRNIKMNRFASETGQCPEKTHDCCPFGRDFAGIAALAPPYRAVKVTGALFHTQGGLAVNEEARVIRADGSALPNLFAAGGAAVGVSGPEASGYLSGNGLVTAIVLGRLAGAAAARVTSF